MVIVRLEQLRKFGITMCQFQKQSESVYLSRKKESIFYFQIKKKVCKCHLLF